MPKLIETPVFIQIFNLEDSVKENPFFGTSLIDLYDQYLEKVKAWADEKYPDAEIIDRCAFAALILYYASGFYGGYGTESYSKERVAEQKVNAFVNQYVNEMTSQEISEKVVELCISSLLK